eukprot:3276765-Rhodomonas_salina.2
MQKGLARKGDRERQRKKASRQRRMCGRTPARGSLAGQRKRGGSRGSEGKGSENLYGDGDSLPRHTSHSAPHNLRKQEASERQSS